MICLFARENRQICASGSGVERRLAKAKVAGSNPVSRSLFLPGNPATMRVSGVSYILQKCWACVGLGICKVDCPSEISPSEAGSALLMPLFF